MRTKRAGTSALGDPASAGTSTLAYPTRFSSEGGGMSWIMVCPIVEWHLVGAWIYVVHEWFPPCPPCILLRGHVRDLCRVQRSPRWQWRSTRLRTAGYPCWSSTLGTLCSRQGRFLSCKEGGGASIKVSSDRPRRSARRGPSPLPPWPALDPARWRLPSATSAAITLRSLPPPPRAADRGAGRSTRGIGPNARAGQGPHAAP